MPIPVIIAVTRPNISGFSIFTKALQIIMIIARITSQLPTVSPTLRDNPTNNASKGEVPRLDLIVNAIPKVRMKIPITKNIYLIRKSPFIKCCNCNKILLHLIYDNIVAFAIKIKDVKYVGDFTRNWDDI